MDLQLRHEVMTAVKEALAVLAERIEFVAAFLFGSHVDGDPGPFSDIDLAVFAEGAQRWSLVERVELATFVQMRVGHRIEPHFFPAKALDHPEPASFAEYVLEHGVRVYPE